MAIKKSLRGRIDGSPNPIDVHVGKRVRMYRTLMGLSQEKLAESLGLTFQQVQKYERGMNRIGASRLWDISRVLNTPIAYFYEGIAEETDQLSPRHIQSKKTEELNVADSVQNLEINPFEKKETLDLIRLYYQIPNRLLARKTLELMKLMQPEEPETHEEDEPKVKKGRKSDKKR